MKKSDNKNKKSKNALLIIYTILLLVITTTITYSGFSTKLALISEVMFRVSADIRVTDIKLESSTNGALENYSPKYNVSETTMGFTLPNKDSSITYRVTVTNFGGIDQTIYNFIEKSLNIDSNDVEIIVSDFTPVCANTECNLKNDDYTIVNNKILNNNNPVQKEFLVTIKAKKPISDPINLIEKYEFRKVYTISFDSNGGINGPDDIRKVDGANVNIPNTIPGFYGYTFTGWTETKDGTGKIYQPLEAYKENKDVLLYAQWEKIDCSLNIDYLVDDVLYESGYNNKIYMGLKINDVDLGYVEDYSEKLEYGTSYEIYGFKIDGFPVSYSKKGKIETNEVIKIPFYTVNFLVNEESNDYVNKSIDSYIVKKDSIYTLSPSKITLDDGRVVTYSINEPKGYTITFDKFVIEPENSKIEAKTNITANYIKSVDNYFITYDLNGGSYESDYSNPLTYNVESDDIKLYNPKKEGYVFEGWTGTNGTEPQTDVTIYKGSTGDRKYTANYRRDNYLFEVVKDIGIKSFDIQIKEPSKSEEIYTNQTSFSENLNYETEITISNIKLEVGYIFDSYNVSDKLTELSGSSNLSKSYKLGSGSAKVSLNSTENTYTVTYISSENGGSTDIQVEQVKYKSLVDLSKTSEREGYKFIGWNTDKNSRTKLDRLEMPHENVIVYAIYSKDLVANFIVQNEYSAVSSFNSTTCTIYNNDKSCLVTSPSLTAKEGYTVYGWNTDKSSTLPSLGFVRETSISNNETYYSIASKPIGSLNITLSGNMNYTGKRVEPIVTIKDNDVTLTKDKDYSVNYSENISKTGTVTITSKKVYNESSKIFYTSSVTKTFTIEKINDVITAKSKTASYTGSKITANSDVETLSNSKLTFTYFDNTNCTGNQLGDAPINVGNYSVKIVSAGNDNYNSAGVCVLHTITPGEPIVTLENKEADYNGNQIQIDAPTIKNPNGSIISIPYTVNYYDGSACSGSSISAPINGGTYSAKVITNENNNLVSAESNCATLKINPIKNPTVVTPVENIKYGEDKEMVVTTKLQGTIYYSVGTELTKDNYTSGKTTIPTSKDLSKDDYYVYYYVKGNSNYKDVSGYVIVSVGILSNPITVKPVTGISYGENKEMVTTKNAQGVVYYSVGTELTEDNYTSEGKKAIPTSEGKNAGDYIIYYFTKGNNNYGKATGKVTVNIAKINDTITLDPVETEYTGDAILSNTAETKSNTKVTYKYYNGENCISENEITGAPISYRDGGYSVKATSDGGSNYNSASICVKHTINKATNPVKVTAKNDLVYSVKSNLLSVSNELYSTMYYSIGTPLTDDNYLALGSTDIPKTYIENGSETIYRNAGSYKLYYYAKGDNNHKSSFNESAINVNIEKANSACTIETEPTFKLPTYSESYITYSCIGDGNISVISKNVDISNDEIITVGETGNNMTQLTANGVGKSLISVYINEGTNYKESEKSQITVDVTSSKFEIKLEDTDKWNDKGEDRNKSVYSVYKKGVYLDSETTEQMTITSNGIKVPTINPYPLKVHTNNDDNYEIENIDYKFLGYYKDSDQLIDENGLITNLFTSTYFSNNDTIEMKLKKYSSLKDPQEREGYTFEGWYTSNNIRVTEDTDFFAENITDVYAHWLKAPKIKSSTTSWTNSSVSISIEEEGTSDSGDVSYQYFISNTSDIPDSNDENWLDVTDDNSVTIDTDDETSRVVYVFYRSVSSILHVNSNGEYAKITSNPSNYALAQIDKIKPSTLIRAYKISDDDPKVTVESGNWSNKYLEFRFNTPTAGPSGGIIYYCMQDSANSDDESDDVCVPYIKDDENNKSIASNDIIPGTDTKEGEYTIRYMVVSGSGIESDIYEYDAKVDVTAPTLVVTAKSLDSKNNEDTDSEDEFETEVITTNSEYTYTKENWSINGYNFNTGESKDNDNGSGIKSIVVNYNDIDLVDNYKNSTPNKEDITDTNSIDISENGYRYGNIIITDMAGNTSKFVFDLRIDDVEPEVEMRAYNKSDKEIASGELSQTGLTYIIKILKKGVSGVNIYTCSTDASSYDPNNPCDPYGNIGSGTDDSITMVRYANVTTLDKYVRIKGVSGAGINSEVQMHYGRVGTADVDIDVYKDDSTSKKVVSKTWVNSKVKFKLSSSAMPNATLKYCVDTTNTCSPDTIVGKDTFTSLSNAGIFYIRYNAKEGTNTSKTLSFAAYVDVNAPIITATGNPTSWTKSNATLSVSVRESVSGLKSISINGKTLKYTKKDNIHTLKYVVSSNGNYTIVATDNAGNKQTKVVKVTMIDKTPPSVSIKMYKANANGNRGTLIRTITSNYVTDKTWVNHYYYFDLSASSDSQSKIKSITMGYSAGGKKTVSTTIDATRRLDVDSPTTTVTSNGARYLVFTVTDNAGNSKVIRVKIYVDTTDPVVSLKLYKANSNGNKVGNTLQTITEANTPILGWKNYRHYFDLSGTADSLSGIASIKMQINKSGIEEVGSTAPGTTDLVTTYDITSEKYKVISNSGNRYIRFTIKDNAGNTVTRNVRVYIDLVKPTITWTGTSSKTDSSLTVYYTCNDKYSKIKENGKVVNSANKSGTINDSGTIYATCTDDAGNITTDKKSFTRSCAKYAQYFDHYVYSCRGPYYGTTFTCPSGYSYDNYNCTTGAGNWCSKIVDSVYYTDYSKCDSYSWTGN